MHKILAVMFFLFSSSANLFAQTEDTWTLKLNGKVLYKGNPDEEQTLSVKPRKFKKSDRLVFSYKMAEPDNSFRRTIYINNAENVVLKKYEMKNQSGSILIKPTSLNTFLKKKQTLDIYTTSLPKSAEQAALVRVRRVKLCKLEVN